MARNTQTLELRDFQGLNNRVGEVVMPFGKMSEVNGFEVIRNSLEQSISASSGSSMDLPAPLWGAFIKKVWIDDATKAAGSFTSNLVYLVVYSYQFARYYSADLTNYLNIAPIVRSEGDAAGHVSCLITGWKYNSMSGANSLRLKKGSATDTFVVSTDFGANWSADKPAQKFGTSFSVTYNSVVTQLTAYFNSTTALNNVGGGEYAEWSVVSPVYPVMTQVYSTPVVNRPVSFTYFDNNLIFTWGRRLMVTNGSGLTCVGYKATMGTSVANFYNHLVVAQFSEGVDIRKPNTKSDMAKHTLAWSDLRGMHDFLPTQANEADVFFLDSEMLTDDAQSGITALGVFDNKAYACTAHSVHEVNYVGLPLVMQIRKLPKWFSCGFMNAMAVTSEGLVSVDMRGKIQIFNGQQPATVDLDVEVPTTELDTMSGVSGNFGRYVHVDYCAHTNSLRVYHARAINWDDGSVENTYIVNYSTVLLTKKLDYKHWTSRLLDTNNKIVLNDSNESLSVCSFSNLEFDLSETNRTETAYLVAFSADENIVKINPQQTSTSVDLTIPIAQLGPLLDRVEIRSVIIDFDISTTISGTKLRLDVDGLDKTRRSTFSTLSDYTKIINLPLHITNKKLHFNNVNAYGNFFRLKLQFFGGAFRNAKIKSILITYYGANKNVER